MASSTTAAGGDEQHRLHKQRQRQRRSVDKQHRIAAILDKARPIFPYRHLEGWKLFFERVEIAPADAIDWGKIPKCLTGEGELRVDAHIAQEGLRRAKLQKKLQKKVEENEITEAEMQEKLAKAFPGGGGGDSASSCTILSAPRNLRKKQQIENFYVLLKDSLDGHDGAMRGSPGIRQGPMPIMECDGDGAMRGSPGIRQAPMPIMECGGDAEYAQHLAATFYDVVDFGSGSGNLTLPFAFLLPHHRFLLVDRNRHALTIARDRAILAGLKNVEFLLYEFDVTRPVGVDPADRLGALRPVPYSGEILRRQVRQAYSRETLYVDIDNQQQAIPCSFDLSKLRFRVGLGLHCCGTFSDVVLDLCVEKRADCLLCPCCNGKMGHGIAALSESDVCPPVGEEGAAAGRGSLPPCTRPNKLLQTPEKSSAKAAETTTTTPINCTTSGMKNSLFATPETQNTPVTTRKTRPLLLPPDYKDYFFECEDGSKTTGEAPRQQECERLLAPNPPLPQPSFQYPRSEPVRGDVCRISGAEMAVLTRAADDVNHPQCRSAKALIEYDRAIHAADRVEEIDREFLVEVGAVGGSGERKQRRRRPCDLREGFSIHDRVHVRMLTPASCTPKNMVVQLVHRGRTRNADAMGEDGENASFKAPSDDEDPL
eukprot:g18734.t1